MCDKLILFLFMHPETELQRFALMIHFKPLSAALLNIYPNAALALFQPAQNWMYQGGMSLQHI